MANRASETTTEQARVAGGYLTLSVIQVVLPWWLYEHSCPVGEGTPKPSTLQLFDVRVWFGCAEMRERRRFLAPGREAKYSIPELHRLVGGTLWRLRASLRRLVAAGLIQWNGTSLHLAESPDEVRVDDLAGFWQAFSSLKNNQRRVPIPRRIVRFIAGGASRAEVATVLAHLLRCSYLRGRKVTSTGNCTAAWVEEVFGVHSTRVKQARARLLRLGMFLEHVMPQWHRNRYGNRIEVNLAWERPAAEAPAHLVGGGDGTTPGTTERTDSRPPVALPHTEIATALEVNTPLPTEGSRNQNPMGLTPPEPPTGVSRTKKSEGHQKVAAPSLVHVVPEDLKSTERLLELHQQAVTRGLVPEGERGALEFVALAEHARTYATSSPEGLFFWGVKNYQRVTKRWVTAEDEEAARRRLRVHRDGADSGPPTSGFPTRVVGLLQARRVEPLPTARFEPSADRDFALRLRRTLAAHGVRDDELILRELVKAKPEWTRERWLRATIPQAMAV